MFGKIKKSKVIFRHILILFFRRFLPLKMFCLIYQDIFYVKYHSGRSERFFDKKKCHQKKKFIKK